MPQLLSTNSIKTYFLLLPHLHHLALSPIGSQQGQKSFVKAFDFCLILYTVMNQRIIINKIHKVPRTSHWINIHGSTYVTVYRLPHSTSNITTFPWESLMGLLSRSKSFHWVERHSINSIDLWIRNLKVLSCKFYNNKYMVASTQITNTKIFVFIAVLVSKLLSRKVFFINKKDNGNC